MCVTVSKCLMSLMKLVYTFDLYNMHETIWGLPLYPSVGDLEKVVLKNFPEVKWNRQFSEREKTLDFHIDVWQCQKLQKLDDNRWLILLPNVV